MSATRATHHYFASLTSGFTSVTNAFMRAPDGRPAALPRRTPSSRRWRDRLLRAGATASPATATSGSTSTAWPPRARTMRDEGDARRLLRNLIEIYGEHDAARRASRRVAELSDYFDTRIPARRTPTGSSGSRACAASGRPSASGATSAGNAENVRHLRLGFYTGDIFTEEPTVERDVPPMLALLDEVQAGRGHGGPRPRGQRARTRTTRCCRRWPRPCGVHRGPRRSARTCASGATATSGSASIPSEANLFVPGLAEHVRRHAQRAS